MAKEQDQTRQTEEDNADAVETKEDTSTDKAVKTSEAFDKLIDENPEDVEETPSGDNETKDSKDSGDKDDSDAEDKDAGKEEDKYSDKDDETDDDKPREDVESKVSDELAKRAIDHGFTEEEIAGLNETELEKFLDVIDSVVAEKDAVDQTDSTQTSDTKKTEDEDTGIKFENEGDIDPEILKAFRSIEQQNKELREIANKLTADIQQEQQVRHAEQQRQFTKRFDGMVDKLGLDFADVFGKGSLNDLSKRSKAYQNRDAVRGRMYALGMGFQAAKQPIPDEQQLFDLAINSLHGEKVKKATGLRLKKKTDTHSKTARVGRAATKKAGKLTGDQKAIKTSLEFDQKIDAAED